MSIKWGNVQKEESNESEKQVNASWIGERLKPLKKQTAKLFAYFVETRNENKHI